MSCKIMQDNAFSGRFLARLLQDIPHLARFLQDIPHIARILQDMPFLNCVQHVPKSPSSMLQPHTNEQVHKKASFTIIHQIHEHKNHAGCLSKSIKNQIRTSKISVVFIVLAGQLRNSRHRQASNVKRTSKRDI